MAMHILTGAGVQRLLQGLTGRSEADDLRRELVAIEVQNAEHIRALTTPSSMAYHDIWWQVVLAEAVQRNEAREAVIRATLDELGEPHQLPADVAALRSAGRLPRLTASEEAARTYAVLGGRP